MMRIQTFVLPSGRVFRGTVQDALAVVRGRARIKVKRTLRKRVTAPRRRVQARLPRPLPTKPHPLPKRLPTHLPPRIPTRPRAMTRPLQVLMLRKALERRGVSSDLVDVEALVDPTLTLPENVENVLGQIAAPALPAPTRSEVANLADRTHAELCEAALEGCRQGQPGACEAYREEGCQPSLEVAG